MIKFIEAIHHDEHGWFAGFVGYPGLPKWTPQRMRAVEWSSVDEDDFGEVDAVYARLESLGLDRKDLTIVVTEG